ncbi:TetR/AcrR family transcriptional regulator [Halosimplex litoreum]|uniref:TetR/AcrR family transcriptional regulator n=1 Tax=Halosimplex litoreum TaxID=1198301 RepID=A0A7T3KUA3_9EURY|nr:TetR/AcrR family transcriptional regulator [Halosimplex litoreum]QPV61753.1 TetR/AcrR family transcriptional regulator [Halosimplex litoreum]
MASEVDVQGDTHREIMGATYHALCKHGYAHLTMQDIADEFDKSRSLLHYHYDTKEELMLAFVDNTVGWVGARLAESDTEDPLGRLEEYVDGFVIESGEEDRETFALALLELRVQAVHNEQFREKLATHYQTNVDTVAEIIADGIEAGVFRPVEPESVGETIYTALVGARMYQVTLGAGHASRRMRDQIAEFVVENLLVDGRTVAEFDVEDAGFGKDDDGED